ncbi:zinc metallochaperone AztD [Cellulomonas telluris]|uniref:zinc metallochaperone AztD n=1 Tax=Cellulomonas telluris TaxID=2306636 RepID=UPI0010A762C0|nr:zinc metallochaperone AztD [Cellulomonas telluris]
MNHPVTRPRRTGVRLAALALPLALLGACAGGSSEPAASSTPSASPEATATKTEAAAVTPRLVLTYDGGLVVLDATTLETVDTIEADGFLRVNPAGDGRHVMVSTQGGFQVLDAGTWAQPHGDHDHYWTSDPVLTDTVFEADEPGHAVVHGDTLALFADGTGEVTVVDPAAVAEGEDAVVREYTTPSAHHGVAVVRTDDTMVVSDGTEDERTGVRLLGADDTEIAATDQCPGVHGEAVAANDVVTVGCQDGIVIVSGQSVTKVQAPDAYGRIGNQAGDEDSPYVLGDYKTDKDAELERPTRVTITDTAAGTLRVVDLPSSYTFRSLARGDAGEALVLGTDGQIHVIDPATATLTRSIPVIDAWEEPMEWQEPRPAIHVLDGTAYVTDPATDRVLAVDVETGEVWNEVTLEVTPNEITSAPGRAPHAHGDDDHAGETAEEHAEHAGETAEEHAEHDHEHEHEHGSEG